MTGSEASQDRACMQLALNTSVMIQGRAGKKVGFGVKSELLRPKPQPPAVWFPGTSVSSLTVW